MKKELQDKILNDHPLLFADKHKGPKETCMYFGIETGDGWYDLIYEACSKIEPLIEKYIEENLDTKCYNCNCDVLKHSSGMYSDMECQTVHFLPYHFRKHVYCMSFCWYNTKQYIKSWREIKYLLRNMVLANIKRKWYSIVNRILYKLYDKFNIGYYKPCHCQNFETKHPRAAQIKEKFAELRFYMTLGTEEIYNIIREAERKSATTCENCGEPGEIRTKGWWFTLCDDCNKIRQEKSRAPWL